MEDIHYARDQAQRTVSPNCGITYGNPRAPKNRPCPTSRTGPLLGGDGAIVVGYYSRNQRMAVTKLPVRTVASKAGSDA
jgi:hypothetical protein